MAHDSYSALSDPTRRRLLTALRGGARPVGELVAELEVSQPTVSKHLKVLRDVGLVTTRAEGQRRYYSIEAETLAGVARWIEELIGYLPASQPESEPGAASTAQPEPALEPDPEQDLVREPAAPPADGGRQPGSGAPDAQDEARPGEDPQAAQPAAQRSRTLPWFTVERTAEAEVLGRLGPDAGAVGPPEATVAQDVEIPVFAVLEEQDTPAQPGAGGPAREQPPAAGTTTQDGPTAAGEAVGQTPPAGGTGETDGEEIAAERPGNRGAGSNVEPDTDVDSAETSEDSDGSAESSLTRPASGNPPVRSGAAHRRQGGLLSTLTGFRRRGRGQRR